MSELKDEREKWVDKIKKLLALSTSPNEHEAAQAMRLAQKFMIKWNVELYEVEGGIKDESIKEKVVEKMKWLLPETRFICPILEEFFCVRHYYDDFWYEDWKSEYRAGRKLIFIGTESNIEIAKYVFEFLLRTFRELWHIYKREEEIKSERFRLSFMNGVKLGLQSKLREEREELLKDDETCTALVAINGVLTRHVEGLNLGSFNRGGYQGTFAVESSGYRNGRQININKAIDERGKVKGQLNG